MPPLLNQWHERAPICTSFPSNFSIASFNLHMEIKWLEAGDCIESKLLHLQLPEQETPHSPKLLLLQQGQILGRMLEAGISFHFLKEKGNECSIWRKNVTCCGPWRSLLTPWASYGRNFVPKGFANIDTKYVGNESQESNMWTVSQPKTVVHRTLSHSDTSLLP